MIDDVPSIPVKTAPADTIATVDALIDDVIFFSVSEKGVTLSKTGFLSKLKVCRSTKQPSNSAEIDRLVEG